MTAEDRLKRLRLRSWRRGTREMDLVLGPFADVNLADLSAAELDLYEDILSQNDQDLYAWVSGRDAPPERLSGLIGRIAGGIGDKSARQSEVP